MPRRKILRNASCHEAPLLVAIVSLHYAASFHSSRKTAIKLFNIAHRGQIEDNPTILAVRSANRK